MDESTQKLVEENTEEDKKKENKNLFQKLKSEENIKFMKETIIFHTKILAFMYGLILIIVFLYLFLSSFFYLNFDSSEIIKSAPFVPAFIILALNIGMAFFYIFEKDFIKSFSSLVIGGVMFVIAGVFAAAFLVITAILGALFKFFTWLF